MNKDEWVHLVIYKPGYKKMNLRVRVIKRDGGDEFTREFLYIDGDTALDQILRYQKELENNKDDKTNN